MKNAPKNGQLEKIWDNIFGGHQHFRKKQFGGQTNFCDSNFLGVKHFLDNIFFGGGKKIVGASKMLGQQFSGGQKIIGTKVCRGSNNCWDKDLQGVKNVSVKCVTGAGLHKVYFSDLGRSEHSNLPGWEH